MRTSLFVPVSLLALAYILLQSGLGVASLAPLATAAAPALLQAVLGGRRTPA